MTMVGQDQDYELGENTMIRLGVGVRVAAALGVFAVAGAGALWMERATRREEDAEVEKRYQAAILREHDALVDWVSKTYVKDESAQYRVQQLSGELRSSIDALKTELAYLRRDVGAISDSVAKLPEISAQLKVLQDRKP